MSKQGHKIQLCEPCLEKLAAASARGGRAGSHEDKVRASELAAANRRRRATKLTFDGKKLSVADWSKQTGISRKTLYRRINLKLPVDQILLAHGAQGASVL